MQDAARRQADERAALEAKVFITQPRLPSHHATTPHPFSLSSAEAQVTTASSASVSRTHVSCACLGV